MLRNGLTKKNLKHSQIQLRTIVFGSLPNISSQSKKILPNGSESLARRHMLNTGFILSMTSTSLQFAFVYIKWCRKHVKMIKK